MGHDRGGWGLPHSAFYLLFRLPPFDVIWMILLIFNHHVFIVSLFRLKYLLLSTNVGSSNYDFFYALNSGVGSLHFDLVSYKTVGWAGGRLVGWLAAWVVGQFVFVKF